MSEREARLEQERARQLMMAELDGELLERERAELKQVLENRPHLKEERKRLMRVKEVTSSMALRPAPEEVWDDYWTSVYSRVERGIGWILVSAGAIVVLGYATYRGVQDLIADTALPPLVKGGILALSLGLVVLLVSVVREKLFVREREPYKDVER